LSDDVLILGASCRAAAQSALRARLHPHCADYFADFDLHTICPVDRVQHRHAGRDFLALALSIPPSCWFYTGGFENHPAWVEQISRRHRLWGVNARALRLVRDPLRVAAVLEDENIPVPAVRRDPLGLPRDGSWLEKPLRSGGGRDIVPLLANHEQISKSCYFQERIDGPSYSALYIGERDGSRLVGVTEQLVGNASSPFAYRGSIGPCPISVNLERKLVRLGQALASAFGLVGWFGVDFILCDDIPWPVEVNPRYTASVEIYELASRQALLGEHRRACEGGDTKAFAPSLPARPAVIAKKIVYANRTWVAPRIDVRTDPSSDLFAVNPIADVPWPEARFAPGDPVMTLLACGDSAAECQSRLADLEREWSAKLGLNLT